jgi:hypothetical protein
VTRCGRAGVRASSVCSRRAGAPAAQQRRAVQ